MSVARVKPVDLSWFERLNTERASTDGSASAMRSADHKSAGAPAALAPPEHNPTGAGDIVDVATAIRNAFGIPAEGAAEAADASAPTDGLPTLLLPTGPVVAALPRLLESACSPTPMTSPTPPEMSSIQPSIHTRAEILPADENWAEALDSRLREMTELASAQPHWQVRDAEPDIDDRHRHAGAGMEASEHSQEILAARAPFASLPLEAMPQRVSTAQRTKPHDMAFDTTPAHAFGQPYAIHAQNPPAAQFAGAIGTHSRRKGAARHGATALRSIGLVSS
jgi:hypothetical protein